MVLKFLVLGMEILPLERSSNSFCAFLFLSWFKFVIVTQAGGRIRGQKVQLFFPQWFPLLNVCKFLIWYFPYWATENFTSILRYLFIYLFLFKRMYCFWSLCSLANLVKLSTTLKSYQKTQIIGSLCRYTNTHTWIGSVVMTIGWK